MKTKGTLAGLAYDRDGHTLITVSVPGDSGQEYDDLKDAPVSVEIKKWHPKRSLDANAYCWVLIDRLAERLGLPRTEVYRQAIREVGGVSETVCAKTDTVRRIAEGWERNGTGWIAEMVPSKLHGCTNLILYAGSSTYDSAQMSRLIDIIVQECRQQGIETMTPAEIAALESDWRAK